MGIIGIAIAIGLAFLVLRALTPRRRLTAPPSTASVAERDEVGESKVAVRARSRHPKATVPRPA